MQSPTTLPRALGTGIHLAFSLLSLLGCEAVSDRPAPAVTTHSSLGGLGAGGTDTATGDERMAESEEPPFAPCDSMICPEEQECRVEDGSAGCFCPLGYTGATCTDNVNECAMEPNPCGAGGVCTDLAPGWVCACAPGYAKDGEACSDENECADGIDGCHDTATCQNVPGDYECECPAGAAGDGLVCFADDPCLDTDCGTGSCLVTPAGATCDCPLGTTGASCETSCIEVDFPDAALQNLVTTKNAPATLDARTWTSTSLSDWLLPDDSSTPVEDLAGLECWTSLEKLELPGHAASSLAPIGGLSRLELLNLGCNPLADLGGLSGLYSLRQLYLDESLCEPTGAVLDLGPLSSLLRLEELVLSARVLSSLAPLSGLPKLRSLALDGVQATGWSSLAELQTLHTLNLRDSNVSDLSFLEKLTSLKVLDVTGISLETPAWLEELSALETLVVSDCDAIAPFEQDLRARGVELIHACP